MPPPIIGSAAAAAATPTPSSITDAPTTHHNVVAPTTDLANTPIAQSSKLQHLQKSRAFIKATKTRCKRRVAAWVRYHLERKDKISRPKAPTIPPNTAPAATPSRNDELPAAAALAARALLSMSEEGRVPTSMDVPDDASLLDVADLASRLVWNVDSLRLF